MHLLLLALAIEVVAPQATLEEPFAAARDRAGNLYICEHKGQKITRIDPAGAVTRFAGTGSPGFGGDNGPASAASFTDPHGIVIAPDNRMYVADTQNHRIRRIDLRTGIISTVAGTGERGYSGDGGPAVKAKFDGTFGIALDAGGRKLYVADLGNRRIRRIEIESGIVTTVAGNGTSGVPRRARAAESPLVDPRAVAADGKGNVYILERNGNALRVLDRGGPHPHPDRAGHCEARYEGAQTPLRGPRRQPDHRRRRKPPGPQVCRRRPDYARNGAASRPHGVYVDGAGTLYICDTDHNRMLKLKL